MTNNEPFKNKIATLFLKEIASKGRFTKIDYLHRLANRDLKQYMPESDERMFDLYVDSAVHLLEENNLIVTNEKGNFADLTEDGIDAANYNSISEYIRNIQRKKKRKEVYELLSKIAPVISTLISVISFTIGLINKDTNITLLITLFLAGITLGFVISEILKKKI